MSLTTCSCGRKCVQCVRKDIEMAYERAEAAKYRNMYLDEKRRADRAERDRDTLRKLRNEERKARAKNDHG